MAGAVGEIPGRGRGVDDLDGGAAGARGAVEASDTRNGLNRPENLAQERRNLLRELTKLNVDSPKTVRDQMRDQVETEGNRKEKFFGSAKYKLAPKDVTEIRAMEPEVAVASLDSDGFNVRWHEAEWYRDYLDSAKALVAMDSLLDPATKAWVNTLGSVLGEFVRMADLSAQDFKHNYKTDITKLVKLYGKEAIYGPKGALNLLLGMSRLRENGVDKRPNLKTIKIVLGTGRDAASKAKDRFVVVMKQNAKVVPGPGGDGEVPGKPEEPEAPVVKPKPQPGPVVVPVPLPKPKDPDVHVPPEPEPNRSDLPKVSSEEFYMKYEVETKFRPKFEKDVATFTSYLTDPEKFKVISDEHICEQKAGEDANAFDIRIGRLFGAGTGEIAVLEKEMDSFVLNYPEFLKEVGYVEAVRIQNVFLLVKQRMIDFARLSATDPNELVRSLVQYNTDILDNCGSADAIGAPMNRHVLEQLVAAAEYLEVKDPNTAKTAEWKAKKEAYKAKLVALR